ncbi:MAG TPA: MFS transporter [Ktedonosporobacter sp.]|nr:MFS transporter [Ktedonosporobacter sp.]
MAKPSIMNRVDDVSILSEETAPSQSVTLGFQLLLCLANMACWICVLPVGLILLPTQIAALDPVHKISNLAIITAVGALAALITNPIAGALSDRTTSPLGRRKPWLIAGTLLSALTLVTMAHTAGFVALVIAWGVFHVAINVLLAALSAVVPDQVPVQQRATVSAITSLALPVGSVLGSLLITKILNIPQIAYYILAGILLVSMLLFVLMLREDLLDRRQVSRFQLRSFLASFWINPVRHPDFAWAWVTRFLVYLSYYVALGYLLYFLQDALHYSRLFPQQTAAQGVTLVQTILTGTLLVTSLLGGILSDKFRRRKIFVIGSSLVIALAFVILALFPSWPALEAAAIVLGIGFGAYLSVDIAMITQVLPSTNAYGKDLGVINIANALPQVVGPTLAALAISLFHSYTALFLLATILALLGAAFVQFIKSVR